MTKGVLRGDPTQFEYNWPDTQVLALLPGVIAVPGLHCHVFLGGGDENLVITGFRVRQVWGEAQAVLVAQLLPNASVNLLDRVVLRYLVKASAGLLCQPLHDLLAIGVTALRSATAAPAATTRVAPSRVATTGIAAAMPAAAGVSRAGITPTRESNSMPTPVASGVVIGLRVGEQDGVHQGVGALGCFNGPGQAHLAALVHAVGEDDQRLAALRLAHDLIGGEKNCVIQ